MAVVPLTLTISLGLVATFIVFFLREHSPRNLSSPERDSLLPLAEETPRTVPVRARAPQPDDACGCRDGSRPACPGCHSHHD